MKQKERDGERKEKETQHKTKRFGVKLRETTHVDFKNW